MMFSGLREGNDNSEHIAGTSELFKNSSSSEKSVYKQ